MLAKQAHACLAIFLLDKYKIKQYLSNFNGQGLAVVNS